MSVHQLEELQKTLKSFFENSQPAKGFDLMSHNPTLFEGYQTFEQEFMYNALKGTDYQIFKERVYTFIRLSVQKAIKQEEARLEKQRAEEQARKEAE